MLEGEIGASPEGAGPGEDNDAAQFFAPVHDATEEKKEQASGLSAPAAARIPPARLDRGWMKKRGTGFPYEWADRYFVLQKGDSSRLAYYKKKEDADRGKDAAGVVDLEGATVETQRGSVKGKIDFGFKITTGKGTQYHLRVDTEEERQAWLSTLKEAAIKTSHSVRPRQGSLGASAAGSLGAPAVVAKPETPPENPLAATTADQGDPRSAGKPGKRVEVEGLDPVKVGDLIYLQLKDVPNPSKNGFLGFPTEDNEAIFIGDVALHNCGVTTTDGNAEMYSNAAFRICPALLYRNRAELREVIKQEADARDSMGSRPSKADEEDAEANKIPLLEASAKREAGKNEFLMQQARVLAASGILSLPLPILYPRALLQHPQFRVPESSELTFSHWPIRSYPASSRNKSSTAL